MWFQDSVVSAWIDQNIMNRIQRNKLVFVETRDSREISLALANYFTVSGWGGWVWSCHSYWSLRTSLQACDNGRGAVLLAIARGKVSEGVDFGVFSFLLLSFGS